MEFWLFVLTAWGIVRWLQQRAYRTKNDERFARVIAALNGFEARFKDLGKLQSRIHELEQRLAATQPDATVPPPSPVPAQSVMTPAVTPSVAATLPPTPPKIAPLEEPTRPPAISAPSKPLATQPVTPAPSIVAPSVRPAVPEEHLKSSPAVPSPPKPTALPPHTPAPPLHPPPSARQHSSDLEEKVGANYLNKIGISILVIGISLFLAYKFPTLNNPEKILLGYFVSFAILGTGIYMERKDRYRIFARALIGGGWALTFFTTYAMHFVKYTQVLETEWVALVLLFIVAAVMVVHTLRYDSQVVTGLAFLLAFTTVAISQNTIYSLTAGAILALGLVAIVHRRQWYELELFGIIASFLNHFIWLAKVIEPMAGHKHMFPEFIPSTALLCFYWAVYRWSYIWRRIQNDAQEKISTVAAILNTGLLLSLFKYQSVHPQLAFYALIALGILELALAYLPVTRRRHIAFTILATIGTILLVAAIPFKFSGMDIAIIWLAQAQILFLAGVFSRERLFRTFGLLAALLTSGFMLISQALPILDTRFAQTFSSPDYLHSVSFLAAALLFYVDAIWIPRRWKQLIDSELEAQCFRALSYFAGLMLFICLWLAFPDSWTAVVWAAAALLLALAGRALESEDLSNQTHFFALASFALSLTVDRTTAAPFLNTAYPLRLVTLSLVIAFFYLCARCIAKENSLHSRDVSEVYTSLAAILVVLLSYYESNWVWTAVAWGTFAALLAILGIVFNRRELSFQAHLIVLAGFVRTLLVNLDATREFHHVTFRFITLSLMAALLYTCAYFSGPRDSDFSRLFSALHSWAGSILIAVLAFKELSSPWIAVTWALFALLLLIIGDRMKRIQLHYQAYVLSVFSVLQLLTVNVNATQPFSLYPGVSLRFVTLGVSATLFYLCSRWAAKGPFAQAPVVGALYTWVASALVGLLLWYELQPMSIALGWALFGLVLFEIGFFLTSLNWRLQAYAAFVFSFFRLAVANTNLSQRDLLFYSLPVAFVLYLIFYQLTRKEAQGSTFSVDQQFQAAPILAYLGSATLVLFTRSYFQDAWFLVAWAALSFLFIATAWGAKQEVFLHQSILLAGLVFFRGLAFELEQSAGANGPWFASSSFYISAASALLFAAEAFAFPLRERYKSATNKALNNSGNFPGLAGAFRRPEQFFFFIPLALVTFLILNEVSQGRVTMFWGIEALAAFLFALAVGERSFRLAGLGLLLVCVAKILILDVWRQQSADRWITLIILGAALVLVSFLYTRYSELIRRYL